MGYSMSTDRYRYTEWQDFGTGDALERELYDHRENQAEVDNVAADARYAQTVRELSTRLRAGWRAALPESRLAGLAQIPGAAQ